MNDSLSSAGFAFGKCHVIYSVSQPVSHSLRQPNFKRITAICISHACTPSITHTHNYTYICLHALTYRNNVNVALLQWTAYQKKNQNTTKRKGKQSKRKTDILTRTHTHTSFELKCMCIEYMLYCVWCKLNTNIRCAIRLL